MGLGVLTAKDARKKKKKVKAERAPRGTYRDLVVDIVYSSGCVTLTKLVEVIAEKLGKPRKTVYNSVAHILVKLVKQGVVERRAEGVYCKPKK
jgi:hypothetical protein